MNPFLQSSDVIDFESPELQGRLAEWRELPPREAAEKAYLFVRDQIGHSYDVCDSRVTTRASQVLREGVALCYGKSHLLAALLRGLEIPAAIRYQRLCLGEGYCLHAFNSVWLDGEWHDVDARGNNERVRAEFLGALAFVPDLGLGEVTYDEYFAQPVRSVLEALGTATDALRMTLPAEV